jgi:hypothetical protein
VNVKKYQQPPPNLNLYVKNIKECNKMLTIKISFFNDGIYIYHPFSMKKKASDVYYMGWCLDEL